MIKKQFQSLLITHFSKDLSEKMWSDIILCCKGSYLLLLALFVLWSWEAWWLVIIARVVVVLLGLRLLSSGLHILVELFSVSISSSILENIVKWFTRTIYFWALQWISVFALLSFGGLLRISETIQLGFWLCIWFWL